MSDLCCNRNLQQSCNMCIYCTFSYKHFFLFFTFYSEWCNIYLYCFDNYSRMKFSALSLFTVFILLIISLKWGRVCICQDSCLTFAISMFRIWASYLVLFCISSAIKAPVYSFYFIPQEHELGNSDCTLRQLGTDLSHSA